MRSIGPLQQVSGDLTILIDVVLRREPWDVQLVVKALHCYQAWVEYSIHEEVKIDILFPYSPF